MRFVNFLYLSISLATVFILGATGETVTEKSGHLNLGIPGIMCLGMCGSVVGCNVYLSLGFTNGFFAIFFVLLFALLFGALGGAIFAFFTVSLKCNQNVTGLTLTTFGIGVNTYVVSSLGQKSEYTTVSHDYFQYLFGEKFATLNAFTRLVFGYGFIFYISIGLAIAATIIMKKTRIGLNLRSCGENPACSDAAGINVSKYRYLATIIGATIASLGGAFLFMNHYKGALEFDVSNFGWLAVALVIFTMWNPSIGIGGSILFAMLYYAPQFLKVGTYGKLADALPYLITIIVLIITSIFNKRETQAPAGLGLSYFREDR